MSPPNSTATREAPQTGGLVRVLVQREGREPEPDWVAVEEPLQIRLQDEPLVVTMRTPGADRELAAGFVFTEGLIDGPDDLESVTRAVDIFESDHPENTVSVKLTAAAAERLPARRVHVERDFRAASSCGVCGRKTIEGLRQDLPPLQPFEVPMDLVRRLPEKMREFQCLFKETGGIHAAGLFNRDGELLTLYEDIGRHNAVDKLVGDALLRRGWPLGEHILVLSGRVGFEVIQKGLRAGIPVLVAVGAASSLAVELSREAGAVLYSFVGPRRGNRHC